MRLQSQVRNRPLDPSRPDWRDMRVPPKFIATPQRSLDIKVEGWDTETEHGRAFVMACSQGYRPINHLEDALSFLCGRYARGVRNYWWNLRFDVDAITKWDEDIARSLHETNEATYGDVSLTYIPRKLLKIKRKGHTCYHYDIMQFYNMGLENAAKKYLYRPAPAIKHDRSRLWMYPLDEVGAYCQWDANATRDLAFMYARGMHAIQIYPKHFISKGNIAKIACQTEADYSTWMDIPNAVTALAWASFRAGWVDLMVRGTVDVWKYDINSAYPKAMRNLPNFKKGIWVRRIDPAADVGFASCRVRYGPTTPPFISAWLTKSLYYPDFDEWITCYLTLSEVRFLQEVADVDIQYAYSFLPHDPDDHPWRGVIDRLLAVKNANKDDPAAYTAAKETVNSCYGNLVETREKEGRVTPGRLFNAVAGSYTTADCRVQLARAALQAGDATVAVATDSITTLKPLRLDTGSKLGQWKVEAEGLQGTFIQPGIYQVANERSHTRGFKTPDDLLTRLETDDRTIQVSWHRPWSMIEALTHGDFAKANEWHEETKTIQLSNARRMWKKEVRTFRDLLRDRFDSVPVPLSAHPKAWR